MSSFSVSRSARRFPCSWHAAADRARTLGGQCSTELALLRVQGLLQGPFQRKTAKVGTARLRYSTSSHSGSGPLCAAFGLTGQALGIADSQQAIMTVQLTLLLHCSRPKTQPFASGARSRSSKLQPRHEKAGRKALLINGHVQAEDGIPGLQNLRAQGVRSFPCSSGFWFAPLAGKR